MQQQSKTFCVFIPNQVTTAKKYFVVIRPQVKSSIKIGKHKNHLKQCLNFLTCKHQIIKITCESSVRSCYLDYCKSKMVWRPSLNTTILCITYLPVKEVN